MPAERPSPRLHPHPALAALALAWYLLGRADAVDLSRGLRLAILVVVAADVVWAVVRARRASVRVVDQPTAVFVGDELGIDVEVRGAGGGLGVAMTTAPGAPWSVVAGDALGPLPGTAPARGVIRQVGVALRAHGPIGLMGYSRTFTLPIRPLWVGPRPERPEVAVRFGAGGEDDTGPPDLGDAVPATVREYRPGDPWRRIAWPVTARAGRLVTRELEREAAPVLRLAVDLGPTPSPAAERAAAVAAWLGREALRSGRTVEVVALGPAGPLHARVDAAGLHRVLAEARSGPLPIPEDRRILVVSPDGLEWR